MQFPLFQDLVEIGRERHNLSEEVVWDIVPRLPQLIPEDQGRRIMEEALQEPTIESNMEMPPSRMRILDQALDVALLHLTTIVPSQPRLVRSEFRANHNVIEQCPTSEQLIHYGYKPHIWLL